MDRIDKALAKLNARERQRVIEVVRLIESGQLANLDIKKLRGVPGIYRVREGKIRILYRPKETGGGNIIMIDRRDDQTYRL